ncbi:response regulator transcription factor [Paenibacillus mucilaginosus]|uniref:NarL family DNA-binding response regulator n=3 Tax=Paenibacillus mucilaginosus TaxID=61624 RepID=H6NFH5_9BACL|nr:response regulator transcription factor [Paenibacillus mucilaginosus]AEI41524.1 DNA-binding response regulator, NarL family (REC-HTH domains) [Paenibacillus mucilaginosus KNP414]AFC30061.1 NarL family DNA-binding response regulator [Paenibacillus mucilaginosus 3016]AFH62321.1 transcriptional regulator [Paenibacillus mucilaginosus K02]MCG7215436.1 response regulator transcription factor [Paenibacillus mucilaginosus]WDM30532.1 response regulator transcription factor [Paenibacillus mucilaginos
MDNNRIRVVIVEDDPDWLRGLQSYLQKEGDIEVVGTASSGEAGVELLERVEADVVLMDIMMSDSPEGLWAAAEIVKCSGARVVMLSSMEEKEMIFEAFKAGAVDYMVKSNFTEIPATIRSAYANRSAIHPSVAAQMREEFRRLKQLEHEVRVRELKNLLTPTEIQVLDLIEKGHTQTQIADKFVVSIRTIKVHVGNILKKLGGKSSKEAAQKAKDMGIL